jgi:3-oxoacyl-[acyl-carrier protein] reductase
MTARIHSDLLAAVPARRAGTPEEVVACVSFLASDAFCDSADLTVGRRPYRVMTNRQG